jgi:hypothetical protein
MAYVFATPIFEAPDEPAHFARAYGIAEGQFLLKDHPRDLILFIRNNFIMHGSPETQIFADYLNTYVSKDNQARIPNIAYNTSLYSPAPYLFHAAMIKIIMMTGVFDNQLSFFVYSCRALSLVLFCASLAISFHICPLLSWPVFWIAATPMALSQASVVSADPIVFCATVFVLALTIGKTQKHTFIIALTIAASFLLLTKPPYSTVLLVPLFSLIFVSRSQQKYKRVGIALAFCISCSGMVLWNFMVIKYEIYQNSLQFIRLFGEITLDPTKQLLGMLGDPLQFIKVLWNTVTTNGISLVHQMVGVLGWLDIPLPAWGVMLWGLLCFLPMLMTDKPDWQKYSHSNWLGMVCIAVSALTAIGLIVSAYMIWMPVGSTIVNLQGRYFHPIAALFLAGWILIKPPWFQLKPVFKPIGAFIMLSVMVVLNSLSLMALFKHYETNVFL